MSTDQVSIHRETYAPEIDSANPEKLEMYRESLEMLEESVQPLGRTRYTLAGCLPGDGADSRMERYRDSLEMLDEMIESDQRKEADAMGFFVQGMLLKELAKLEHYRASLTSA